jgi:hypothetical protein
MKLKLLLWKRAVFAVLLTLLLSAVGVTKATAQTFTVGNLNYSLNDDGASVTVTGHVNGTSATGELVIPESVELYGTSYPVTAIGGHAFYSCTGLTGTLVIPNSVITIGESAFWYCIGFADLSLGSAVQGIEYFAFSQCHGFIDTLSIPESVTYIRGAAFEYCNFTSLDYNAVNCNIASDWLYQCNSLSSLNIGENVQTIPNDFLSGRATITGELVIPETVTSIGSSAFSGCSGLTGSLNIPENVTSIGSNAFNSCNGFTGSLTLGNSVTTIGENAFNGCSGLTGSLTIPNSVNSIGANAFSGCTGFSGTLTLGNSVTQIGNTAFFGACQGFTSFVVLPVVPPTLGNNVFISMNYNMPVSVPCGSLEAYQNAQGWSVFTNFAESKDRLFAFNSILKDYVCCIFVRTGSKVVSYEINRTGTILAD